ncbi:MAG TPA: MoaD/ThiS family protein [Chryseosolibacter sp.]|nr:MoaD/ThiS family protein [Chryseosolibacter sp.]
MKKIKLKAFGVTKEILGGREIFFEFNGDTVLDLRTALQSRFSDLKGLNSLLIAVNNQYAEDSSSISETDEIALIPPVSGG